MQNIEVPKYSQSPPPPLRKNVRLKVLSCFLASCRISSVKSFSHLPNVGKSHAVWVQGFTGPKKLKPLSEYCFCIHWKLKVLVMKYLCDISWSLPVGQRVVLSFLCLLSHLFTNRYSITTIRMGGRFLPVVISLANYFSIVIILHFLILVWSNSILRWYGQTHLLFEPNNCNFIIHDFYIMSYVTLLYW